MFLQSWSTIFSTQVKLLLFFPLKYNKTVCQGCLSYKKPALKIHPKFSPSKVFVSQHVPLVFLLYRQCHHTVTCHDLSQIKFKLRQCQNRLCVYTNLTYSCSFTHPSKKINFSYGRHFFLGS